MGNGRKKRGLNGGLSGVMRVRTLRLERACDETMARLAGNKSLPNINASIFYFNSYNNIFLLQFL
jgi:hypothetical protein